MSEGKKGIAGKAIIDTDPGHDDAMALMLALRSPQLEVIAVTTVAGNSTLENTTRNARWTLNLLGRNDIPVYSGCAKPLERELVQAVVHGKSGLEGIDPENEPKLTGNAVDRIIGLVQENPGLAIITLGPLTNIASAIKKDPGAMSLAGEIFIMGGAIEAPGNKNRTAEFNFFVDPEAASIVMDFPVKKTIVPLDPCNSVRFTLADFEGVKNPALRTALVKMAKPYIKNISGDEGIPFALMYDPLTVFSALHPEHCSAREMNIQVETKGELTRGMSVAERRAKHAPKAKPNASVVMSISEKEFRAFFSKALEE